VALSRDGQRIVSGSADKTVRVWDAYCGQLLRTVQGNIMGVSAVAVSRASSTNRNPGRTGPSERSARPPLGERAIPSVAHPDARGVRI
jgi:hypothetical protein